MYWKKLLSAVLLLAALLYCASSAFASSNFVIGELERGSIDHTDGGDVTGEVAQDKMYKAYFPIVFVSSSSISCDHEIGLDTVVANTRTNFSSVKPGDIVCIAAGRRDHLVIKNFQGTPQNPITFINSGGQVVIDSSSSHGILVRNSRFFRLTGSGTPDLEYGIKIFGSTNVGIGISYKSSNFEVDHIEITDVQGAGISAKTKGVCSDGSTNNYDYDGDGITEGDLDDVVNRDTFTQFESVLHDNYVHNVGTEGLYIGSSFYSDGKNVHCAHGDETVYDSVLEGVDIYNNRIADTGWDGIQVGSATQRCAIHHNLILRDSRANRRYQRSGIMNNRGSVCNIYSNFVKDGIGPGIYVQGNGGNILYNNVIVNAGHNRDLGSQGGDGISIRTGSNPGNSVYVLNNTVVNPGNFGVRFTSNKGSDSRIQNNIVVGPGNYGSYGPHAYVQTGGRTNVTVSHNLSRRILVDVKFKGPEMDDYSIRPDSPAVDSGTDPNLDKVTTDFAGRVRPQGAFYDIGAYEYGFPPRP